MLTAGGPKGGGIQRALRRPRETQGRSAPAGESDLFAIMRAVREQRLAETEIRWQGRRGGLHRAGQRRLSRKYERQRRSPVWRTRKRQARRCTTRAQDDGRRLCDGRRPRVGRDGAGRYAGRRSPGICRGGKIHFEGRAYAPRYRKPRYGMTPSVSFAGTAPSREGGFWHK